ncbi:Na+/H+ antiporter NhaC family protein [Alkaliphilus transvaalensis]|uniref:Na+/H+ antiporter NhaC family protein n=1 Tax=Alkaliphilus transvaalensis TaxID=114628 RepID=UPI00047D3219|nr:Na+/H+ antiporter NhaC family protein [Alkaliphilus transvaalensis]
MEHLRIKPKDTPILLMMIVSFILICILLNISLLFGFLGSISLTSYILIKRGMGVKKLKELICEGILECKTIYLLILLIGATVSVWLSSGVVPTMIFYGLEYMRGMNFLLAAFLITSLMAVFMGTAIGTISTIGLALLGIGRGFGIPAHILLGAVISGAFIADKISPISGLLNLTLEATKLKYQDAFKAMIITLIPTMLVTSLVYYYIGRNYIVSLNSPSIGEYQEAILGGFYISPWLFLLPVGILSLSILGFKTIKTISLGLVGGIVVSVFLQKVAFASVLHAMFWGFKGTTESQQLNDILVSGGVVSMIEVVLIVAGAVCLSSLLESSGLIKPMISKTIASIKTEGQLIFKTGLISSILTIVTCDQSVGIILPGRLFKEKYEEFGVEATTLARTISDTGTIIAPIIPWNVNALIIGMISGISAVAYGPYAILCYIAPVISLISLYLFKGKKYHRFRSNPNVHNLE